MAALTADSIMNRLDVVAPEITPVIFTAPHNIFLRRDGKPDHKPEDYTSFLAREFAGSTGGGLLAWSRREIERSKEYRSNSNDNRPDPTNRDPNYLAKEELDDSPWHMTLNALFSRCLEIHLGQAAVRPGVAPQPIMSFDIHGAAGSDIDLYVGLKAMTQRETAETSGRCAHFRSSLARDLEMLLAPRGFVAATNAEHRLQGAWNEDLNRFTVSQQAARIGFTLVAQIELSRRLRKALHADAEFRRLFAVGLLRAGSTASQEWRNSK
jgi:hypothetical protein